MLQLVTSFTDISSNSAHQKRSTHAGGHLTTRYQATRQKGIIMKRIRTNALLVSSFAGAAALASLSAAAMDILAPVVSSTPVVQQVAVPRQVCSNQPYITQAPRSGAGALMGALAGGAAGNAIGDGGGRAAATMIGLVGGAMLGDRIEAGAPQIQNLPQCATQTFYENRVSHYNVVYEYQRTRYTTQMLNDPGLYVRLQVTPVGAMATAPQAYYQPAPMPPAYVQPMVAAPAYSAYPGYPAYYPHAYSAPAYYMPAYAPIYSPIGLSLNFGYSRSYGGYGRHRR